jgi:hypothetical protein
MQKLQDLEVQFTRLKQSEAVIEQEGAHRVIGVLNRMTKLLDSANKLKPAPDLKHVSTQTAPRLELAAAPSD